MSDYGPDDSVCGTPAPMRPDSQRVLVGMAAFLIEAETAIAKVADLEKQLEFERESVAVGRASLTEALRVQQVQAKRIEELTGVVAEFERSALDYAGQSQLSSQEAERLRFALQDAERRVAALEAAAHVTTFATDVEAEVAEGFRRFLHALGYKGARSDVEPAIAHVERLAAHERRQTGGNEPPVLRDEASQPRSFEKIRRPCTCGAEGPINFEHAKDCPR